MSFFPACSPQYATSPVYSFSFCKIYLWFIIAMTLVFQLKDRPTRSLAIAQEKKINLFIVFGTSHLLSGPTGYIHSLQELFFTLNGTVLQPFKIHQLPSAIDGAS